MNDVIKLLQKHRSYRDFDEEYKLPAEELQAILDASRQAPSWMNGQAYSIVVLDDKTMQGKLADAMGGNPQMGTCSTFLLYLMDMRRMEVAAEMRSADYKVSEDIDALLVTATDAALALQNATVAAESLGYGTVAIGSVRRIAEEIIDMFALPPYVYPLCGLCIGKATVEMRIKPRLPERCVVFRNHYDDSAFRDCLEEYDKTMDVFAEARETKPWTTKFADRYSEVSNKKTAPNLRKQKLL